MTSPTDPPASPPPPDDEVPKLPRGRGLTLSTPQIVRIVGMIAVLVFLLVMQKPCANGISKFVTSYGSGSAAGSGAGQAATGSAGSADRELDQYERLRPGMSEAEVKAVIERARHKADPAAAGSSSPAAGSATTGTAVGSAAP